MRGIPGAIIATLGVVFPSFVIISIIAAVLRNFADIPAVKSAFAGIRVCVCVLIFNAVVKLWKSAVKDWYCGAIFGVVLLLSLLTELSPVVYVLLAAVAGIAIKAIGGAKK